MASKSIQSAEDLRRHLYLPASTRTLDCNKAAKPNFARTHLSTNWKKVVFSDEEKWNLGGPDGCRHYCRDLRKEN
ncbi:unnamed protein product [Heligmosomoides polygyrus]|uniref:Uncharacterized protein n=1 Tax=Heligmosomoides polygyrus TaxID=6339 RepID=A0A183FKB8_HELPZ|nr:unnamed protein product [Heligmosomoides polygyrus]